MHERSVAYEATEMGVLLALLVEEQQVAAPEVVDGYKPALGPQRARVARNIYPDAGVAVAYQPAAVEARRRVPAVLVWFAKHGKRDIRRTAGRGIGCLRPRRRRQRGRRAGAPCEHQQKEA